MIFFADKNDIDRIEKKAGKYGDMNKHFFLYQ
jgi:hypothetical protein